MFSPTLTIQHQRHVSSADRYGVNWHISNSAHNDLQHLEKELDFCLIENEALRLATFIAS